jgi:hypothetical protein
VDGVFVKGSLALGDDHRGWSRLISDLGPALEGDNGAGEHEQHRGAGEE